MRIEKKPASPRNTERKTVPPAAPPVIAEMLTVVAAVGCKVTWMSVSCTVVDVLLAETLEAEDIVLLVVLWATFRWSSLGSWAQKKAKRPISVKISVAQYGRSA